MKNALVFQQYLLFILGRNSLQKRIAHVNNREGFDGSHSNYDKQLWRSIFTGNHKFLNVIYE